MLARKSSSLVLLLVFSFAFGQQMPEPWEIEKKRIEEKYGTKPPELRGEAKEEKKKQETKQPQVKKVKVYDISQEVLKEPSREVSFGTNLRQKEEERREGQREVQRETQRQAQERQKEEFYALCVVEKPIEVSLEEKREVLPCVMLKGGSKRLTKGEFVFIPVLQEYKLLAQVVSMDGRAVEVDKAVVLDASGGTTNLADEVDTKLASKILLRASQRTGQQVSGAVENVLSRAGSTVITSSGSAVSTTNVDEALRQVPKASLYLALANLLSSTSEEVFKDKALPPIFKVRAGKEIEVRGVFR